MLQICLSLHVIMSHVHRFVYTPCQRQHSRCGEHKLLGLHALLQANPALEAISIDLEVVFGEAFGAFWPAKMPPKWKCEGLEGLLEQSVKRKFLQRLGKVPRRGLAPSRIAELLEKLQPRSLRQ